MIEEWHPALDRAGHTHLILLHQKLDQVRLLIGIQHSRQRRYVRPRLPIATVIAIDRAGGGRQQPVLLSDGEGAIKVVEKQRFEAALAADESMAQFPAQW